MVIREGAAKPPRAAASPAYLEQSAASTARLGTTPAGIAAQLGQASSEAFVAGMDRAFILSAVVIVLFSALSYVLIKDSVASARREPATAAEAALAAEAAD